MAAGESTEPGFSQDVVAAAAPAAPAAAPAAAAALPNSCCAKLLKKYQRLETSRNALREAVKLLQKENDKLLKQNSDLSKASKEERLRGDSEETAKEAESAARDMLEKEIIELKAHTSNLEKKQSICKNENELLCISELEEETRKLKQVLGEERKRREFEKNKVQEEMKKAREAHRLLKVETTKAEENRRLADTERQTANEWRAACEKLKCEANEAREQLVAQIRKAEEAHKMVEAEKQKATREKKRADSQKLESERNKKLVEVARKKVMEEKSRADNLTEKLEEEKKRSKDLRINIEVEKKNAMEEKSRADQLFEKLEERKKIVGLQREFDVLCAGRETISSGNHGRRHPEIVTEGSNVKLLKEKLKLKKEQLKHVKNIQKLDKARLALIRKEIHDLKRDWLQLLSRFDMLDHLAGGIEGIDDVAKLRQNLEIEANLFPHNSINAPYFGLSAGELPFNSGVRRECSAYQLSRGSCPRPNSGTSFELEPPVGSSLRVKSPSSDKSSYPASFSDTKFMGSQGKDRFFVSSSADPRKNINQRAPTVEVLRKNGKEAEIQDNGALVEACGGSFQEKALKSISGSREDMDKVHDGSRKRKRIERSLESPALLCPDHNQMHSKMKEIDSKLNDISALRAGDTVDVQCWAKDGSENHKNKHQAAIRSQFASLISFEEMIKGDCLKLLNLDNDADEERYRAAFEAPLSPDLPNIVSSSIEEPLNDETCYLVDGSVNKLGDESDYLGYRFDVIDLEVRSNMMGLNGPPAGEASTLTSSVMGYHHGAKQIPKCIVGHMNMKAINIMRVIHYWTNVICEASNVSKEDFDGPLLEKVSLEPELLPEERISLIFSLLLCNVCSRVMADTIADGNFAVSAICLTVNSAMETCWVFLKNIQVDTLVSSIEDFLLNREVVMFGNVGCGMPSLESNECSPLDGSDNNVSSTPATLDQFISGCILMASICLEVNKVDVLLEFSYKILQTGKSNLSWTLLALHVFASICGERFLSPNSCDFLVTALRLVVLLLESGDRSLSLLSSHVKLKCCPMAFSPCRQCPFDVDSVSLENFISALLDELELCIQLRDNLINSSESTERCNDTTRFRSSGLDIDCGESCNIYKQGKLIADCTNYPAARDLCYLSEIISLLELFGSYMSWEWTYKNVVTRLLEMLELCSCEEYSAALLVLVGHLGRFGIDEGGYGLKSVQELQSKLSVLIEANATKSRSLPFQFAAVGALLSLLPSTFSEIVDMHTVPLLDPSHLQANQIWNWFAQLSREHQSLASSFFR